VGGAHVAEQCLSLLVMSNALRAEECRADSRASLEGGGGGGGGAGTAVGPGRIGPRVGPRSSRERPLGSTTRAATRKTRVQAGALTRDPRRRRPSTRA